MGSDGHSVCCYRDQSVRPDSLDLGAAGFCRISRRHSVNTYGGSYLCALLQVSAMTAACRRAEVTRPVPASLGGISNSLELWKRIEAVSLVLLVFLGAENSWKSNSDTLAVLPIVTHPLEYVRQKFNRSTRISTVLSFSVVILPVVDAGKPSTTTQSERVLIAECWWLPLGGLTCRNL